MNGYKKAGFIAVGALICGGIGSGIALWLHNRSEEASAPVTAKITAAHPFAALPASPSLGKQEVAQIPAASSNPAVAPEAPTPGEIEWEGYKREFGPDLAFFETDYLHGQRKTGMSISASDANLFDDALKRVSATGKCALPVVQNAAGTYASIDNFSIPKPEYYLACDKDDLNNLVMSSINESAVQNPGARSAQYDILIAGVDDAGNYTGEDITLRCSLEGPNENGHYAAVCSDPRSWSAVPRSGPAADSPNL